MKKILLLFLSFCFMGVIVGCQTTDQEKFNFSLSITGEGNVTGTKTGKYSKDTEIHLQATPNEGYIFLGYYLDEDVQSTSNEYRFQLVENVELVAKFGLEEDNSYVYQTFSHKFLQSDFMGSGYDTQAGSKEINGLIWNYDAFTFLGQSSDGIQIGSSKKPQVTPWTIETLFNENVILTSLSISGRNSSGTQLEISGTDYTYSQTLLNAEYQMYTFEDINATISLLKISLSTTSKSFYFDTLTFTCKVSTDSQLVFSTDKETATPAVPGENGVPLTKYAPIAKEEYYDEIDFELTGDALKKELNEKISIMTMYAYGEDTNILLYTDASIDSPGYLYGIYDGDAIVASNTGIWNKEHVWACSQMGLGGNARPSSSTKNKSSDLHNLRVSCQNSNGMHGNKFYDNENSMVAFFPNITGTPNISHQYEGDHRGDVARILFYMATRYLELHLDDELNGDDDLSMGKLSILLEWNKLDPVDEFEIQRNNRIYEYQGNRNPFIDYPELADQIWNSEHTIDESILYTSSDEYDNVWKENNMGMFLYQNSSLLIKSNSNGVEKSTCLGSIMENKYMIVETSIKEYFIW